MKRIFALSLLLMTASMAVCQIPNYTLADVAKHATAADCWMVLNTNKVYNFTAFIPTHPGGSGMATSCGTDGTARFNGIGHSTTAIGEEATYLIGNLVATPPPISVTIVPTIVSVQVGRTQQFVATVANSTQGVTWRATLGAVSSTGLYTAPSAAGTATITATSVQDTTKMATATVTVTSVPVPISVAIAPTTANLTAGGAQQFTAAVVSSTQGVTWRTTIGTISATGLLTTTAAGSGVVTATSVQDTTKSASAQVTVVPVPPPAITVTLIPGSVTLVLNGSQHFTAQVSNSTQGVNWSVATNLGVLNATGLTADFVASAVGSTSVTATSIQDPTKSASATVVIIPVINPPPPPSGTLDPIEIAKHNTAADCWMIIGTNVYDVTKFIPIHPHAGAPVIPFCGKDATGAFSQVGHSNRAFTLLPSFLLGPLVPNPTVPNQQLCAVTQATRSFTIACNPSTPPVPVTTYRCTSSIVATGVRVTCTAGRTGN
jgi:cytochrome b involved in lipid metabolism